MDTNSSCLFAFAGVFRRTKDIIMHGNILGLLIASFTFLATTTFMAAEQKPPVQPAATAPAQSLKSRPFNGTIKIVNAPARQIVLQGKKAQTFNILPQTKITKNSNAAKLEQIVVGDKVGGYARERVGGGWDALSVKATTQEKSVKK